MVASLGRQTRSGLNSASGGGVRSGWRTESVAGCPAQPSIILGRNHLVLKAIGAVYESLGEFFPNAPRLEDKICLARFRPAGPPRSDFAGLTKQIPD